MVPFAYKTSVPALSNQVTLPMLSVEFFICRFVEVRTNYVEYSEWNR